MTQERLDAHVRGLKPSSTLAINAESRRLIGLGKRVYRFGLGQSPFPEGTIVSGGLSKWCGAGGWRLGTFAFPPSLRWLQTAMAAVASETDSAVSEPIQYATVTAFEGSDEIER